MCDVIFFFQIIQFSFKDDYYQYTIFVPKKPNNLITLTKKLQDINVYNRALQNFKEKEFKLYLPKYESDTSVTNNVNILRKVKNT